MKFYGMISYAGAPPEEAWKETYDEPSVKTAEDAERVVKGYVEYFNNTLRPGEKPRALHSAGIEGAGTKHLWEKHSLVTQSSHLGSHDVMRCAVCHIKGKRFGLSPDVKVDSLYKKFAKVCPGEPVPLSAHERKKKDKGDRQ